jgi:hypothetical protein
VEGPVFKVGRSQLGVKFDLLAGLKANESYGTHAATA